MFVCALVLWNVPVRPHELRLRLEERRVIRPDSRRGKGTDVSSGLGGGDAILVALAFGAGRMTLGLRTMPEIVATLPGDKSEFSRELDARLRERFPAGNEPGQADWLPRQANLLPDWPQRGANVERIHFERLDLHKIVRVLWRADEAGSLTSVSGAYEGHCL